MLWQTFCVPENEEIKTVFVTFGRFSNFFRRLRVCDVLPTHLLPLAEATARQTKSIRNVKMPIIIFVVNYWEYEVRNVFIYPTFSAFRGLRLPSIRNDRSAVVQFFFFRIKRDIWCHFFLLPTAVINLLESDSMLANDPFVPCTVLFIFGTKHERRRKSHSLFVRFWGNIDARTCVPVQHTSERINIS